MQQLFYLHGWEECLKAIDPIIGNKCRIHVDIEEYGVGGRAQQPRQSLIRRLKYIQKLDITKKDIGLRSAQVLER